MHAAVTLADDVDAVALDSPDDERRDRARLREVLAAAPIIALAYDHRAANQLALEWGVRAATINNLRLSMASSTRRWSARRPGRPEPRRPRGPTRARSQA